MAWRGSSVNSCAQLLGSVPACREAELWSWALDVGERYVAEADPAGWHEMLVVTEGRLMIEFADRQVTLQLGEHAIYSSAQCYTYVNLHEGITRFIRNVVS